MNAHRPFSVDACRALGLPGVRCLHPDTFERHRPAMRAAERDWHRVE